MGPCRYRDPLCAGGAHRICSQRRIRADQLDVFVFDQVAQLLARPELLAAGEGSVAGRAPAPDDELVAAQLDRIDRRIDAAGSERRRLADLYQAGVGESAGCDASAPWEGDHGARSASTAASRSASDGRL